MTVGRQLIISTNVTVLAAAPAEASSITITPPPSSIVNPTEDLVLQANILPGLSVGSGKWECTEGHLSLPGLLAAAAIGALEEPFLALPAKTLIQGQYYTFVFAGVAGAVVGLRSEMRVQVS